MTPLIITILVLNILFFIIDMNDRWHVLKDSPWFKLLALLVIYLFLGFLSPIYSFYEFIKESNK